VTSNISAGSIVLDGPSGEVNLVWKNKDPVARRPLAPGNYRLRTVRIEREVKGEIWTLSMGGPAKRTIRIDKATTTSIAIDTTVKLRGINRPRKGDRLQLGFALSNGRGRGLSIYRDGKRVLVRYELQSKAGKRLGGGPMNYG